MKRRLSLLLALFLVLSLFLVACGDTEEPVESEGPTDSEEETSSNPAIAREGSEDTIIIGMTEAKGEFMPVYYSTVYDAYVNEYMFDALITNDEEGNYIPHVAESWEISEDNKTYTFHLRDDVTFWDGEPLTAHDVEFTYLAMADPNYDGRYFLYPQLMEGYEEYVEGDAEDMSGIQVIDDYTISFTFKEVEATNIDYLTMFIMPEHHYGFEKGDIETLKSKMLDPLGSGGYKYVGYEPAQYVELEANPDYFLGEPKIKNLILKFVTPDTMMAELETGAVDVLEGVTNTVENFEIMEGMGFIHLNSFPNNGYSYIGFNLRDPRLADKNVRQALAYGFDRQGFVDNFFKGHGSVAHVPLSPVSWAYTDELEEKMNKYEYNPDKANQLLDEAGWVMGDDGIREKDGMRLEFVYSTYPDVEWTEQLAPVLIDNWGKIGVGLEINYMDFNAMTDAVFEQQDFDMWNMAWALDIDPDAYDVFHSSQSVKSGNNAGGFDNPRNDELLIAGRKELDQEKRKDIYEEWALLINKELPYIFVYQRDQWNMVNDRIQGFEASPYQEISHPAVYLNWEIAQ